MSSDQFGFRYFTEQSPDAVAIVEHNGSQWTRARLMALANRMTRAFDAAGAREGDAVGIAARNCAEYIAIYLAAVQAGLYVVPINWHLSLSEIAFIVENSGAKFIVTHDRLGETLLAGLADLAKAAGAISVVIGQSPHFQSVDDFVSGLDSGEVSGPANGRVMAYTSATTGRPKGVELPLKNSAASLKRIVQWHQSLGINLCDDNVHLCTSMLYHSAPLEGSVVALHMGHRLVMVDQWQPERLLQLIERHRVTTTFMVPTMFVRLLKLPEEVRRKYSTDSLRFVVHAGAPCPIPVKKAMLDWWGPIIWESYGAAEGQGAIASPEDWLKYPGTVGRPFPGSRFMILNEAGEHVPADEVGSIYFVPFTADRFQYKGDPAATQACYRGDFITVGDVGYISGEGYVFVCDRRTDIVISSGMNIYPAEIEQVLIQHPAIVDCAVFGVPHELLGAVPCAAVQLRSGVSEAPELTMEILKFLNANLSSMKLPKQIRYVEKIPRDPNGKVYKRLLGPPVPSERVSARTPS